MNKLLKNNDALNENNIGTWELVVEAGKVPMLFCDPSMKVLLGVDKDITPEDCYSYHKEHVYNEDANIFSAYADKLFRGFNSEIVYRYKNSDGDIRIIRCSGARSEYNDDKCVMTGTHKDITDTVCFDYREISEKENILKNNHFLGFWKIEINGDLGNFVNADDSILMKLGASTNNLDNSIWKKMLSEKKTEEVKRFLKKVAEDKTRGKRELDIPLKIKDKIKWVKIICNYVEFGDNSGEIIGTTFDVSDEYSKNYYDHITGGLNKAGFISAAEDLFSKEPKSNYAMIYIDINNFKAINEIAGFNAGDELLKKLYDTLNSKKIINAKLVARKDSDRFVVLARKENINVEDLENECAREWNYNDKKFYLSVKIGIYYIEEDISIQKMIDRARLAKDLIKNNELKHINVFKKEHLTNYIDSADVIRFLPEAIQKRQFEVFYQPIIDASTEEIASAEALVRWKRKNKYISPGVFIPVLEEAGLISNVDFFVAEEVYNMLNTRDEERKKNVPVSINLSWCDLNDNRILDTLNSFVVTANAKNKVIKVELTETAMSKMDDKKKEILEHLKMNNINLLLDDFGTGYSSFNTLNEYEFDILKIDKKFIDNLLVDSKSKKIVKAIIEMCHSLNIKTVAEGVEEEAQYIFLKENKCDYIQGYYFSPPLEREEFERLLNNQSY